MRTGMLNDSVCQCICVAGAPTVLLVVVFVICGGREVRLSSGSAPRKAMSRASNDLLKALQLLVLCINDRCQVKEDESMRTDQA